MDSFENFQYDSASSYGGIGVVDDTSSIYTANTTSQSHLPVDLESLSIADDRSVVTSPNGHNHNGHSHTSSRSGIDEDFDAVLDDLKDEGQVDLPPHACRLVSIWPLLVLFHQQRLLVTVAYTPPHPWSNV